MIESHKSSHGWILTLCGWILSALVVPFIPEIMSGGRIIGYPLMEYVATIGLFAVILLVVWIPTGIRASSSKIQWSRASGRRGAEGVYRADPGVYSDLQVLLE